MICNDNHPSVTYDTYGNGGSWGYSSGRNADWNDDPGDVHYGEKGEVRYEFTFKGTGVDLRMPAGPAQGEMEVYVDGQLKATVNAYAETRSAQQPLFSIANLPAGEHTIKVVKKSGELMLVDQLIFHIAPGSTPPTTPPNPTNPPSSPSVRRHLQAVQRIRRSSEIRPVRFRWTSFGRRQLMARSRMKSS